MEKSGQKCIGLLTGDFCWNDVGRLASGDELELKRRAANATNVPLDAIER